MDRLGEHVRKYYEAYDERYKTVHARGMSWASEQSTPIVLETIRKYHITPQDSILEIGCGEGRDARAVLAQGYRLLATDLSGEAIAYCKNKMPVYQDRFAVLDCLHGEHHHQYAFIYGVAVLHMLVLDEDRHSFYQWISRHLTGQGIALICTMGDGKTEVQSDIHTAFDLQPREHLSGERLTVAGTSCRMVSFETFEHEIQSNQLSLVEKGITAALPEFDCLMYAVVKKRS
ncbi:MAG: class I SAM-dependent methyltransferase [Clostridiales bacterium]|nr:class I SAM-dependent methyltransferase [Clostridiales bacterium]